MKKINPKNLTIRNITVNSKNVKKGDLFVAIKGKHYDGHDYVEEAVRRGAKFCVVSRNIWGKDSRKRGAASIILVDDTRLELSRLAQELYDKPCNKLKVIGITGTNGKTTVSFLLDKILSDSGAKTGVIGTIFYKVDRKKIDADRTTPDALRLNNLLHQMVNEKVGYAILEVSSHALHQKRVCHIYYDAAIFMNITSEHLDYHRDMKNYFESKAGIFDNLKINGTAILNEDDPKTSILKRRISKNVITFGLKNRADIFASDIRSTINSSCFKIMTPKGKLNIKTKLIGRHNVSNILAAISVAYLYKLDLRGVEDSINSFCQPPGRLEDMHGGQDFKVFIDYAHTKDAISKVLKALKPYARRKLITVFGCGGDRDKTKRPQMGKVASRLSDYTIITSDNPRSEKPEDIARDVARGIIKKSAKSYSIILDRKEAIKAALDIAKKDDIVLIAGKGHERTQIIGDKQIRFDDHEVVLKLLKGKAKDGFERIN